MSTSMPQCCSEMKNSPPCFCAGTYDPSVTLRVHIKITRLSSVDNWYTCAVTVSPEQTSQFHATHKHNRSVCTAPNADRLVNTNHHWTGKCTAELTSCYIGSCWFGRTRGWVSTYNRGWATIVTIATLPNSSHLAAALIETRPCTNSTCPSIVWHQMELWKGHAPMPFAMWNCHNAKVDLMYSSWHWVAANLPLATQPMHWMLYGLSLAVAYSNEPLL